MEEGTEQLWPTLLRFHHEVIMPEMRALVTTSIDALRNDMNGHFDALYKRLERIDSEITTLNFAVKNLEARMAGVEQKLDKMAMKSDVEALEQRVLEIEHELAEIKARL